MSQMTEDELARDVEAVLDRVRAGETIEILRDGIAIADVSAHRPRTMSRERFNELMRSLTSSD